MISCPPEFSPSDAWTPAERTLAAQYIEDEFLKRHREQNFPTNEETFDVVERLVFLVRAPSGLLESNRRKILEGSAS
jgi:hypothetical protein